MKFNKYNISEDLKAGLEQMGLRKPTDIQYKAIPHILDGEDVLAIAQTGTGKTAAFAIPIVHLVNEQKKAGVADGIQCIVLVPTRELSQQIADVFIDIGSRTNVKTYAVYGGVDQDPQIKTINKGVDIIVTTPGRMFDLIHQKVIKTANVKALVLDEADRMLEKGFIKDIYDIKKRIPRNHQTLFFSATINKQIKRLAYSLVSNPIRIQVSPKDPVASNIVHSVAHIEMDDKRFFLESLIRNNPDSKILVFVRTKVRAERVLTAMQRVEIEGLTLHSEKDQKTRLFTLNNFKSGHMKLLIATDVSSRGIDIPMVDIVVNYDLPEIPENYVHRVGRTGRANKKGTAISFCSKSEEPLLKEIEKLVNKPIQVIDISYDENTIIKQSSMETHSDWKTLIAENEANMSNKKSKKKKKKK